METYERVTYAGTSCQPQAVRGGGAIATVVTTCCATALFSLSLLAAAMLLALRVMGKV